MEHNEPIVSRRHMLLLGGAALFPGQVAAGGAVGRTIETARGSKVIEKERVEYMNKAADLYIESLTKEVAKLMPGQMDNVPKGFEGQIIALSRAYLANMIQLYGFTPPVSSAFAAHVMQYAFGRAIRDHSLDNRVVIVIEDIWREHSWQAVEDALAEK